MEVPLAISGPVTIALIVLLGIFVYPRWLARPAGRVAVVVATVLLAGLFAFFELAGARDSTGGAIGAALIALLPLVAGIVVARLSRKAEPGTE
jgi:hypothetical protein